MQSSPFMVKIVLSELSDRSDLVKRAKWWTISTEFQQIEVRRRRGEERKIQRDPYKGRSGAGQGGSAVPSARRADHGGDGFLPNLAPMHRSSPRDTQIRKAKCIY
jgi:hypothetical protein